MRFRYFDLIASPLQPVVSVGEGDPAKGYDLSNGFEALKVPVLAQGR